MKHKVGRNDPCPCGSGMKYKKCCLPKIEHSNEKIENIESFQKFRKIINGAKAVKKFIDILSIFMKGERITKISEGLNEMINAEKEVNNISKTCDTFNDIFSSRGWINYELMNFNVVKKAVEIANNGKIEEAESYLINYYKENVESLIKFTRFTEGFDIRYNLIELACQDYLEGRYHSCILLLFTIIDGVVADCKELEGNKGFFADSEEPIYAWNSIAAHRKGLTFIRKLLYENRGKTNTEEIEVPYRNGIMHGRDLNYANQKVAAKLWNTFFALRDAVVAIRGKGTIPKKEKKTTLNDMIKDTVEGFQKIDKMKEDLEKWEPRRLIPNEDFPESGISSDYGENTPERTLVEFFENWKENNFGKIAQKIPGRDFERYKLGTLVAKFKNGRFKNKKLISYKILKITDEDLDVTAIDTELLVEKEGKQITANANFRLVYEIDKEIMFRTFEGGDWKFINCYSSIRQI